MLRTATLIRNPNVGWLRSPEQAASEMNATKEEMKIIDQVFGSSLRIGKNYQLKSSQA